MLAEGSGDRLAACSGVHRPLSCPCPPRPFAHPPAPCLPSPQIMFYVPVRKCVGFAVCRHAAAWPAMAVGALPRPACSRRQLGLTPRCQPVTLPFLFCRCCSRERRSMGGVVVLQCAGMPLPAGSLRRQLRLFSAQANPSLPTPLPSLASSAARWERAAAPRCSTRWSSAPSTWAAR